MIRAPLLILGLLALNIAPALVSAEPDATEERASAFSAGRAGSDEALTRTERTLGGVAAALLLLVFTAGLLAHHRAAQGIDGAHTELTRRLEPDESERTS
jgi:hypothetical protein